METPKITDSYKRIFTLPLVSFQLFNRDDSEILKLLTEDDLDRFFSANFHEMTKSQSVLPNYISTILTKLCKKRISFLADVLKPVWIQNALITPQFSTFVNSLLLSCCNLSHISLLSSILEIILALPTTFTDHEHLLETLTTLVQIKSFDALDLPSKQKLVEFTATFIPLIDLTVDKLFSRSVTFLTHLTRMCYCQASVLF